MSNEKDKIRDMVYALMRGNKEEARELSNDVMSEKTARMVGEMNDTGSDSSVVSGKHDAELHDNTERKGSVSKATGIDHKDYTGEKPNVYSKKDAVDSKPVNEDEEIDIDDIVTDEEDNK